ncbi:hypothetical protein U7230_10845 [Carboxydochorda subterranea]|uniref:Uncharacterized protein n=1 Tax=Carboxydichorda subterranea TaxID=3109565 RepID=A0ABZ1BUU7_9FIRM|nr:hypothetical protein [Limnochorda sp. L945t]WRP16586.1 hypothetical protein U7230_10845 [Limnochorda sp. L945t]
MAPARKGPAVAPGGLPQLDDAARAIVLALAGWHARHGRGGEGRTLAELFQAARARGETVPPEDVLKGAAERLVFAGLVDARPTGTGRQRLRLTEAGLELAGRLQAQAPPARPVAPRRRAARRAGATATAVDPIPGRVEALEGRLSTVEARVQAMEALLGSASERMARLEALLGAPSARPRAGAGETQPDSSPPPLSLEAFRERLLATIDRLDRETRQFGLVPVPQVRKALAGVVDGEAFDRLVLELAARREVWLVPHDHPASLSPEQQAGSIRDPWLGQLYYWFRRGM